MTRRRRPGSACRAAVLGLFLAAGLARAQTTAVASKGLALVFDAGTRCVTLADRQSGVLLDRLAVTLESGGRSVALADPQVAVSAAADPTQGRLRLTLGQAAVLVFALGESDVELRVEGAPADASVAVAWPAVLEGRAWPGFTRDEAAADRGVLVTTLGPAEVPGAGSLYGLERDLALAAGPAERVRWAWSGQAWELRAAGPAAAAPLTLRLLPHYYRDTLGVRYFAPIRKRPRWPTAPVVAMTWYGIAAMNGRPAQTAERLFPQVDWVAEHLRPYAGDSLVFQLDDNYLQTDDAGLRRLADYIRAKGLVPGIWFTPYVLAPKAEAQAHPEWFLHAVDGQLVPTFGGINWGGNPTLNVTHAGAVDAWFGAGWRQANDTWGFDFFKIDGQPDVAQAYRRAVDGGGVDGYRRGLEIARGLIGPAQFVNGCWGTAVDGIGWLDGARTGGDTGYDPHATQVVLQWNYLNNVTWWCDPDAAACLYRASLERVRLNAQARALTGQQFLTDDLWTEVPPAVCRVWQQSFPMLDITPANLYPIQEWRRYDLFDLRIAKPWGTWDVVGWFNFDAQPLAATLDLARLPLPPGAQEFEVFDYWESTYLGPCRRDAKLTRTLLPYEGRLLAIRPAVPDRPDLLSTSRHLSQGGLDLERCDWRREGERWVVSGRSSHLVKGDPYELVFVAGRYSVATHASAAGRTTATRVGGVARVSLVPERDGTADWEVAFAPITGPFLDVVPAALDLVGDAAAEIEIRNLGPTPAQLQLQPSGPQLRLGPHPAEIAPWPAIIRVPVTADVAGLEPGATRTVTLTVGPPAAGTPAPTVTVRVHAPPPENLAAKAKVSASSEWSAEYTAQRAADGSPYTRWNSREGDVNGAWLEFTWDAPVRVDRVVIDECLDYGPRIEAWRLLAGSGDLAEVAKGEGVGRSRTVDLATPVEATRLRLVVDRAAVVPTIWEVAVQRLRQGP